jgi:hypothetical protein
VDSTRPLSKFPLLRSRDVEEVRGCFSRIYATPILMPTGALDDFNATMNGCHLGSVALVYAAFGVATGFEFPATGAVSRLFPIRGSGRSTSGRVSAELAAGAGAMIASDLPHQTQVSGDYEHFVLRVSERALTEKLAAMTGATINKPLRIDPEQNFKHPAAKMLQQYLPLLAATLSDAVPPFPDWWVRQTEQLLLTLMLCGHRHNYSHLLDEDAPDAAPHQVRLAEEYIEANAAKGVTLEELAEITGVSAFSLFSAFRKFRGYSPLEFATQVRSGRGRRK